MNAPQQDCVVTPPAEACSPHARRHVRSAYPRRLLPSHLQRSLRDPSTPRRRQRLPQRSPRWAGPSLKMTTGFPEASWVCSAWPASGASRSLRSGPLAQGRPIGARSQADTHRARTVPCGLGVPHETARRTGRVRGLHGSPAKPARRWVVMELATTIPAVAGKTVRTQSATRPRAGGRPGPKQPPAGRPSQ
jgi:hypothetical protein